MNDQIATRLKAAAATPVVDGDVMPRRIAIDKAIAWCKREFPDHFHPDDYAPPPPKRIAQRRGSSPGEAD
jgi:hypothetical protein